MTAAAARRKQDPSEAPVPPTRSDPRRRRPVEQTGRMTLRNKRPDRVYKAVSKADPEYGLERYLSMGYEIEKYEGPAGLRFAYGGNSKPGEPLESMGMVVVSMSTDDYQQLVMYGEDGNGGQAAADEQEDRIRHRDKGLGALTTGLNPDHFDVEKVDGRGRRMSGLETELVKDNPFEG